jgi:hypothetical protein
MRRIREGISDREAHAVREIKSFLRRVALRRRGKKAVLVQGSPTSVEKNEITPHRYWRGRVTKVESVKKKSEQTNSHN